MMSRPWVLVFLLLLIVFTSQFEWKQQFGTEIEPNAELLKEQHGFKREEAVKEKIILSQEKNIQKLNELVRELREQLAQCRDENRSGSKSSIPFSDLLTELDRQPIIED